MGPFFQARHRAQHNPEKIGRSVTASARLPIGVHPRPIECFEPHAQICTKFAGHPANSNNSQPIIKNWLRFAKKARPSLDLAWGPWERGASIVNWEAFRNPRRPANLASAIGRVGASSIRLTPTIASQLSKIGFVSQKRRGLLSSSPGAHGNAAHPSSIGEAFRNPRRPANIASAIGESARHRFDSVKQGLAPTNGLSYNPRNGWEGQVCRSWFR